MKTITKLINAVFAVVTTAVGAVTANADPGDIFVSDVANGTIHRFAPDSTEYPLFARGLATEGLAFDSAGNLFEADYGSNTIYEFAPDGTRTPFATAVASCSPSPCPAGPYGLAFDGAGNLFATDGYDGVGYTTTIYKFAPDSTKSIFGGQGDCSSNFADCRAYAGLAFDSAGYLFATNDDYRSVHSIDKFAPDGNRTTFARGLSYPVGLAFDTAGYLFEADDGSGWVYEFAADGTQSTFANLGSNSPEGLAFDSAGYLFVTGTSSGNIYKIAPDGTLSIFGGIVGNPTFIAIQPPAPSPTPTPTPTATPTATPLRYRPLPNPTPRRVR